MKKVNVKLNKFYASFLILVFLFTSIPQTLRGQELNNLEPYLSIAKLASGESAYLFTKRLTQDDMEGRQSGTKGCGLAAQWIASQFEDYGLLPFEDLSYFQPVEVPYFNLVPPFNFQFQDRKNLIKPIYRDDFMVFHYSGKGKVSNKCVFVGYGLDEPYDNYNDYKGISLKGQTALMLVNLPSFFGNNDGIYSIYNRINTAVNYGATSIILLTESISDAPFRFDRKMALGFDARIPVLITQPELSRTLILPSQLNLDDVIKKIESTQKPYSFPVDIDLQIEVNFISETRISQNVIGYIPAVDPSKKESILITAHYDALGVDYLNKSVFHGANDNASSTACMLEIARTITSRECLPSVNIVFIAFTGEEEGLLGSYQYVKDPLFSLYKIQAVLNMEEVGTFDGVNIAGTSRSKYPELSKKIVAAAKLLNYRFSIIPDLLYPGSDHYPFNEKEIPSVCFAKLPLPEGYPEYHKITDTIKIISPSSLEIFCQLVTLLTLSYSNVAYFDFSQIKMTETGNHPFVIYTGTCYLPPSSKLEFYINGDKLEWIPTEVFILYLPLKIGENKTHVEIKYKYSKWIEKNFTRIFKPGPALRIDFNQDFQINITDFAMMAKKMDNIALPYHGNSLFDLNQDKQINEEDFELFTIESN